VIYLLDESYRRTLEENYESERKTRLLDPLIICVFR